MIDKKKFYSKKFAHLSIQFTMQKDSRVDMKITTNDFMNDNGYDFSKKTLDATLHGYYLSVEKNLEESDHKFLKSFCESYLRNINNPSPPMNSEIIIRILEDYESDPLKMAIRIADLQNGNYNLARQILELKKRSQ